MILSPTKIRIKRIILINSTRNILFKEGFLKARIVFFRCTTKFGKSFSRIPFILL